MANYSKKFGGAVYLTLNGSLVTLTAEDITNPSFSYKAPSFYEAASLGKIDEALLTILTKFDSTVSGLVNVKEIEDKIDKVKNIPVLKQIITSELVITEFTIKPSDKDDKNVDLHNAKYAFGFGLRLTEGNTLGPVTLDGIAFSIELNQTAV
ncbi:hypothetical protein [Flavobacterium sp. NKUCC04_CG]|uniref:hypothetical protein n=1 Tax=Flavobacterium sp. NKUCC04_CG TaxID=2842121 RepID=UPI001C5BCC35|nr:hypothetical protein [Flavobacterium sp. NKUCC04_CG]MBW3519854.1 hypothetical protein [Flavobacterium sp. NKUCC04_CG]